MPRANQNKAMLIRSRQQQVLTLYSQGRTPDEIALSLKMQVEQVNADIAKATDRLLAHYTCPPQHTFIRYAVFNLSIIRKLQQSVERFERDKATVQYNSVISALRAQSDIHDKILEKGLEFGVVERKRASKASRQPSDIKAMIKREILTLSTLLDEVDLSVQFHSARRSLAVKEARVAQYQASRYTPIIIKPVVGPHGVIRAVPDWKYPKKPYTRRADGKAVEMALSKLSPEQQEHFRIAQELRQLTTSIEGEQASSMVIPSKPNAAKQTSTHEEGQQASPSPAQGSAWLMPPSTPGKP